MAGMVIREYFTAHKYHFNSLNLLYKINYRMFHKTEDMRKEVSYNVFGALFPLNMRDLKTSPDKLKIIGRVSLELAEGKVCEYIAICYLQKKYHTLLEESYYSLEYVTPVKRTQTREEIFYDKRLSNPSSTL